MQIKQTRLSNGVRLIVVPMLGTETATALAMFGTGSRAEIRAEQGLAHFTEHMFFKGTTRRPTTLDVASTIENIGGEFNAFTDKENTAYYTKLPAMHLETGLDFISDLVQNPLLPPAEVEREKGVVIEEINMYEDTPMRNVADIIDKAVWGDTPMGWSIAGTRETVSSFKQENVDRFIKTNYVAPNLVLAIAGNVKLEEAEQLAEKYFGSVRDGQATTPTSMVEVPNGKRQQIKTKATEQTHFILAFPTYAADDERRHAARVLSALLGAGMSSRLFISVRERQGLCYYIHSQVHQFKEGGLMQIQAGVDTKRLNQALQSVILEINKIKAEPAGADELQRAKEIIKGRLLIHLEDSEAVANFVAKQLILGHQLETPDKTIKHIDAVTVKDIQDTAKELFTSEKLAFSTVGPVKPEEIKPFNLGV